MTVKRLRPLAPPDVLAEWYGEVYDPAGHEGRIDATVALAIREIPPTARGRVADLSCGDATIARSVSVNHAELHLGDLAVLPAELPGTKYCGPIEETIEMLPPVDVFVCSETIEHLDTPDVVLAMIRDVSDFLVLSTPIECWDDTNGQHCWAWDREGVESLLRFAQWRPTAFERFPTDVYTYGIWVAR